MLRVLCVHAQRITDHQSYVVCGFVIMALIGQGNLSLSSYVVKALAIIIVQ